jgi:ATP/ADP translocase
VSALPERAVFYAAVAPLLAFYALFATVIYPAAPALHWDASGVLAGVPAGLHGLVKVGAPGQAAAPALQGQVPR